MRLKSLWIDGFKNLNNFEIDFENRDGITVLIGNNASGKSNILEVISAIFASLYNATLDELNFKFDLIYTIRDTDIEISNCKNGAPVKQKIEYRIRKLGDQSWNDSKPQALKKYHPSQVIALYSGEELRLWEDYYQNFHIKFFNSILK